MRAWQFSVSSLLITAAAISVWLWLFINVIWPSPVDAAVALGILVDVTTAIHHLLRDKRRTWSISAFLAGVLVGGSLFLVAWLNWWVS